jgi:hypothetical protein
MKDNDWPNDFKDSKQLYLSLIGGSALAIIILSRDIMELLFPNASHVRFITSITLFGILWVIFLGSIAKYIRLRNALDELDILKKKNNKKL